MDLERLDTIMMDINLLYIESKKALSLENKIEIYNKGSILIKEGEKLIENLENMIENINLDDKNPSIDINNIIRLLSLPNISFKEVIEIIKDLSYKKNEIPNSIEIIDIENEIICLD